MTYHSYKIQCLKCKNYLIIPFLIKHRKREKIVKEVAKYHCPNCGSTPFWLTIGWEKNA